MNIHVSDGWVSDANGNRCSVQYFGGEEAARAALVSLVNCNNCTNCSGCSECRWCRGCRGCRWCSGCRGCRGCSGCSECSVCSGCSECKWCRGCSECSGCRWCSEIHNAKNPIVVGPFRSDRYQFVMGEGGTIHAGCRVFPSMAEAREHWTKTRGGTALGDETMRILDFLEAEASARAGR